MSLFADHSSVLEAIEGLRPNSSGWVYAVCPFCSEAGSSKRRLSFNHDWGWYRCWNPGCVAEPGFKVKNWVVTPTEKVVVERPQLQLPEEFVPLTSGTKITYSLVGRRYYDYLKRRGVSDQAILEVGIGYCPSGPYGGMVIVPVYLGGKLEGYNGRAIIGKRFKNAKNDEGGYRAMLNGDALLVDTDLPLYIVEGQFDCLRHWPYAAACLGKPTGAQLEMMRNTKRPLLILLDADAWRESWAWAVHLRVFEGIDAIPVYLDSGWDPGDTDPQRVFELAMDAISRESLELPPICRD